MAFARSARFWRYDEWQMMMIFFVVLMTLFPFELLAQEKQSPPPASSVSFFPHESVSEIRWLRSAVLVLTDAGKVRRSTDQGKTWSDTRMATMGRVHDLIVSPANEDSAVALSETHVCTTQDAGETWLTVDFQAAEVIGADTAEPSARSSHHKQHKWSQVAEGNPFRIEAVKMHPRYGDWLLFLVRDDANCGVRKKDAAESVMAKLREMTRSQLMSNGNPSFAGTTESNSPVSKCLKRLYISRDLGKTVELAPIKVFNADWSHSHLSRMYALVPSSSFYSFANADFMDVSISDDFFKTKRFASVRGVDRLLSESTYSSSSEYALEEFLFLQQPNILKGFRFGGSAVAVMISTDHGNTFSKARIPPGMESFTVLDTSEGQVFLSVETTASASQAEGDEEIEGKTTLHRHLYMSDALGTNFSLSLPFLEDPHKEFVKVEGLEGVYLANVLDFRNGRVAKTMITHNKGATWKRLPRPVSLANHVVVPAECVSDTECTLHLTDLTDGLISSDSASGIILARGNIGRSVNRHSIGGFLSRDGGLTWEQVPGDGAKLFSIGDSGGVVTMVDSSRPTNVLEYTYDQGSTWEHMEFASPDEKISVTSIEIDAVEKGVTFLLQGTKSLGEVGAIVSATLGSGLPLCTQEDYEQWNVGENSRYGESRCLMGREVTITRRKRAPHCLNGLRREQKETIRVCECTDEDYECDVGYMRSPEGDGASDGERPCVRDESVDLNYTLVEPAVCFDMYAVSRGYRKIAGDACKGGLDLSPRFVACKPKGMRSKGWLLLMIIAALAYGIIKGGNRAGAFLKRHSKHFNGLREANFVERLREWLELKITSFSFLRWFRSASHTSVSIPHASKYELVGSGKDVPQQPTADLFLDLETDDDQGEHIREIEAGVLAQTVPTAKENNDDPAWPRPAGHDAARPNKSPNSALPHMGFGDDV